MKIAAASLLMNKHNDNLERLTLNDSLALIFTITILVLLYLTIGAKVKESFTDRDYDPLWKRFLVFLFWPIPLIIDFIKEF